MEELQKLYDVLVREGKYTKSFEEFQSKWSQDQSYQTKVYDVMSRDGFYTKDKDSFLQKYSGNATQEPQVVPVKKKDIGVSNTPTPQQGTTALPSEDGSLATPQPTEEEDYFTGSFGNVLRGFDDIVPLGIGDFVDDMARSAALGYRQGKSDEESFNIGIKGPKTSYKEIQQFIDAKKNAQQMEPSAEMQNYQKIYEEEGKGFWGVVKGIANNPTVFPEIMLNSFVRMASNSDALKAGGAAIGTGAAYGATTGAIVTPEFAGAGAIPGAMSGAASAILYAFGLASTVVESGATFGELLTEELKGKEMTKENVKAILEDPKKLQSIRNKAIARGVIIGTIDTITGKVASGVGAKILTKSAAKSAVGAATKKAVTKAVAAGAAVEALGGSTGEATARAAIGQDMDVSEIALEGLAELPGGVRSTIQARFAKPSYKVNGEKVTASDIDNLIDTMTPEQLHATDIVIDNDYEGRMFKIQDKVVTNTIKKEVKQANPDLNEPSLNAITQLEKDLQSLEGNKTQTGKDKASLLRSKIKDIQENQLEEEVVTETIKTEQDVIQDDEVDSEISRLDDYNKEILENEKSYSWEKELANEYFADKRKYIEKTLEIAKKALKENPESGFDKRSVEKAEKALKELETPTTNESVLRTEQPEVGLQGMGEGNAQEETIITEKPEEVVLAKETSFEPMSEEDLKGYEEAVKQGDIDESLISELDKESIDEAYKQRDAELELAETTTEGFGNKEMFLHENLGRIRPSDFDSYGDANQRKGNKSFSIKYLSEKATPLDARLAELSELFGSEITPNDAINYILDRESNPEKYKRSKEKIRKLNNAAKIMFSPEKAYEVYMGLRNDAKSMSALDELAGKVLSDEQVKIIKNHLKQKYGETNATADRSLQRTNATSKGIKADTAIKTLEKSKEYIEADDIQKEDLVRATRKEFGLKEKSAPSVNKLFGKLKDIKKITMSEKSLLVKQIRDKIKGAKDVIKTTKEISQQLVKDIKELESTGKITPTQSLNMISKFSKVNMLNEVSVSNFVDYMGKVFADADYDNKINVAKKKLKAAKKNINTKIGIANGLASPLQTLFSINPSLIPIKNLERYIELVDMFSARQAILKLDEISQVTKDVNDILDEINNELSLADELSFRLNYSDNKITKDGVLDYAATIKNMLKKGDITEEEAEIMTKYKSEIAPQVEKSKATDEEIAEEKEELEKEVKKSIINSSDLPTRDERSVAKRIAEYLKTPFIKELSSAELKNLIKGIDNINNGYLPHQAELILEKLDSLSDGKIEANVMNKANLKTIAQLVNTTYNTIKSKITGKDAIFEMIRRTPLFNIDQILGNFKTEELYYALLGKSAKAEAQISFELKTIQDKLQKAQDKILKSFGLNPLKAKISNYKIRTYQLQLENDSNPGDKRVNPAVEYIKATIKHIKKLESQYNENDVKILEDILKNFAPDGQIDIDKLYKSFNSAEKEAIKTFQEIKKSETEKAEFTGAVIRGKRIVPLNNHTHISVLGDNSKEDLDVGVSFANEYNDSLKPSTKAKNLMERTPGAKPINFDAYSTALKSAKYVLLDYHLTAPIRTARKSIKAAEVELEKNGEMSEEKRRIFNSVNKSFELALSDLVTNSYVQTSNTQDVIGFISKQGYRAVLAGLGKSGVELISNLGFVVFDPFTFYKGVENMGILLSEDGPAIMNNSKSIQTNRVFASGLSGRMIDLGILDQSVGTKSSKTRGKIINKAQQIWNLTGKKFIKNPVELTADALISSPDKVIMRPYWLGSYITELEKQLGRKVTKEDLKKIAENDEVFMNENEVAIEAATQVADRKSKLMGATKNAFAGLLRGKTRAEDKAGIAIVKNFNAFMTNFMVYEFNAAKTGIMAAVGQGTMTKKEGAAVLAGVITRMTVYNLLIKSVSAGVSGLIGSALGFDDDEEEEKKTVDQLATQALTSTFATLMLGRDFGNISKTAVNYGFEEYVTKEYLQGLRTGEYDPYKDNILFNSLQVDEKTGEMKTWENIPNFMGSYGPAAKTAALAIKSLSADDKKEADAIERQEKERNIRLPLEILGNLGYVPLYKEIRKSVMDDIYKGLKNASDVQQGEEYKKYYENKKKIEIIDEIVQKTTDQELIGAAEKKITEIKYSVDEDYANYLKELNTIENYKKDKLLVDPETNKKYENVSDLEKYNPNLWNENFGPNSEWYKEHKSEKELDKLINEELTKIKDKENNYSASVKKSTRKNSDGTYKSSYSKKTTSSGGSGSTSRTTSTVRQDGEVISTYKRTSGPK